MIACDLLERRLLSTSDFVLDESITGLLAFGHAKCSDVGGSRADALDMFPTWQRLWKFFPHYVRIRDSIFSGSAPKPFVASSALAADLAEHLVSVGLLTRKGPTFFANGPDASRRLRGGWLEELGAVAAEDAGCPEVKFSQHIKWTSQYTGDTYENEIDVLARNGSKLIFVSCKALDPLATTSRDGALRIFNAMKEVAYWRQHFGAGRGEAVLLTTADFVDEQRRRYRNGSLLQRAEALNVRLVTSDFGDYDGMAAAFRSALSHSGKA